MLLIFYSCLCYAKLIVPWSSVLLGTTVQMFPIQGGSSVYLNLTFLSSFKKGLNVVLKNILQCNCKGKNLQLWDVYDNVNSYMPPLLVLNSGMFVTGLISIVLWNSSGPALQTGTSLSPLSPHRCHQERASPWVHVPKLPPCFWIPGSNNSLLCFPSACKAGTSPGFNQTWFVADVLMFLNLLTVICIRGNTSTDAA